MPINNKYKQLGSYVIEKNLMKSFKRYCFYDKVSMSEVVHRLVLFYTCGEFRDIFDEDKYQTYCEYYNIPYKEV